VAGGAKPVQAESDVVGGRIEPITHVVRRGENFWTISRHYYGSGRFFKALWKANAGRVPQIDELYIGTSILVPAPEDLDPRYIEPAPASGGSTPDRRRADPPAGNAAAPAPESRAGAPRDAMTIRTGRASDKDPDDLFAAGDELAAAKVAGSRSSRGSARPAQPEDATRDASNEIDPAPPRKPRVHVVKPRETLRSIAKRELGDSRRENEILDLNRDLVDDPNDLPEGTPLRLPPQ
jgi:nucleoid-associated protein YgaU